MTWLYLPNSPFSVEQEAACSEPGTCLDGELSVTSNGINMPSKCSRPASEMDTSTMPQSGMTCGPSTGVPGLDWWMSCLRASRASRTASREECWPQMTQEMDGLPQSASFAKLDRESPGWKTFQVSYLDDTVTLAPYSKSWTKRGTVLNGIAYRQKRLVRRINANGSGFWPTPRAKEDSAWQWNGSRTKKTPTLLGKVRMYPTPTARDYKSPNKNGNFKDQLPNVIGGQLNPDWVEWLMGWPIGWTALEPLETDRFLEWWQKHGGG